MNDEAKKWIEFAKMDLEVADHLLKNMYPQPLEIICYHSEQAAEKSLKAILFTNNKEVPRTHDLSFLLGKCSQDIEIEESYIDMCDRLTPFGVVIRYPHELPIDLPLAQKAKDYANKIYEWSKEIIQTIEKSREIEDKEVKSSKPKKKKIR